MFPKPMATGLVCTLQRIFAISHSPVPSSYFWSTLHALYDVTYAVFNNNFDVCRVYMHDMLYFVMFRYEMLHYFFSFQQNIEPGQTQYVEIGTRTGCHDIINVMSAN